MISDALMYELSQLFPDYTVHFVEPEDVDQQPPYFIVNLVSGSPQGSGQSGRWQIRIVTSDRDSIESTTAPAIRYRFHDQSGLFGEPGKEENFILCGVVLETTITKTDSGVYFKDIDLKIFYK